MSILEAVNRLILIFQYEEINYPMINWHLEDTISELQRIAKNNLNSTKEWEDKFKAVYVKMTCANNDFHGRNVKEKLYSKDSG